MKRKVELLHLEVINETEQLYVFGTMFNGQVYAQQIMLNTALPIEIQDNLFIAIINLLETMTRADAADAEEVQRKA